MVLVVFNNQRIRKIRRSRGFFFDVKGRRQWQIKQDGIAETLTDLKYVGESGESVMEGLFMVAFTRFPALGGGFRKKVKAVKDVVL